jgi:hypothetical protein
MPVSSFYLLAPYVAADAIWGLVNGDRATARSRSALPDGP